MKASIISMWLVACSLGLSACGAKGSNAVSTPETSEVKAVIGGKSIKLGYAVFSQSNKADAGGKKYSVSLSDWDVCAWATEHDPAKSPKTMTQLGLYLVDAAGGVVNFPNIGTYKVAVPAANATGQLIDPQSSGMSVIRDCVKNYPVIVGGTVTITQANNGAAKGEINLTFDDGTVATGPFTTEACTGPFPKAEDLPTNDPDTCQG